MTDFITALHTLAEGCDYGDLKDELIRDTIAVGVREQKLSTKFSLDKTSQRRMQYFAQGSSKKSSSSDNILMLLAPQKQQLSSIVCIQLANYNASTASVDQLGNPRLGVRATGVVYKKLTP